MSKTIDFNGKRYKEVPRPNPDKTCTDCDLRAMDCVPLPCKSTIFKLKKYQPLDLDNLPEDFTPENYKVQYDFEDGWDESCNFNLNVRDVPKAIAMMKNAISAERILYRYKPRKKKPVPAYRQITDRERLMARVTQMVYDKVYFYIRHRGNDWMLPGFFSFQDTNNVTWVEFEPITGKPIGAPRKFTEKIPLDNNQAED